MFVPHVQTLVQELNAGTISLEKSKNLVSSFNATGAKGLAVVRELVDQHDGQARVGDNGGEGARFIIELPEAGRPTPDIAEGAP